MGEDCGKAILAAFRFLEDVGLQIETLRRSLKRLLQEWSGQQDRFSLGEFREDDCQDSSSWLYRSTLDTFEVYLAAKRGRKASVAHGAFQISLAPPSRDSDETFVPYLVILLAGLTKEFDYDQWECEEFQLDQKYLEDPDEWDEPWIETSPWSWTDKDKLCAAFAVPLTNFRNEADIRTQVIKRFEGELQSLHERAQLKA